MGLDRDRPVLVAGAGGFIGGHLVRYLCDQGFGTVRGVDAKPVNQWHQLDQRAEIHQADLSLRESALAAVEGCGSVINLAADMGGMGFIEANKALCMLSVLINTNLLLAARAAGVQRYFFASSACVYAAGHQVDYDVTPLKEADAYPAMPEDGYGWEKLFSERMCRHFTEDFGLATRVARYHNIYGPDGTWDGGREKAPAAICRKVARAVRDGGREIEIWGSGAQTRSFTYIDDCLVGTLLIADGDVAEPINLGSSEMVTVNQLVDLVEAIAGVSLTRRYNLEAPTGVNGRNSDNSFIRACFGWEPTTRLADGLERTYRWVYDQVCAEERGRAGVSLARG